MEPLGEVYKEAKNNGITIINLTCPNVLKIHELADKYAKLDYFIFVIGEKNHPEMLGTISFCGLNYYVIENINDIENALNKLTNSNKKKSIVIVQTTYNLNDFELISKILLEKVPNIIIKNTICNATKLRQDETEKIAKQVDFMIVIGAKHSSNSTKLYNIAKANCSNTIFIENKNELLIDKIKKFEKVGIMAGASTPEQSIVDIIEIIKNI